ncbi:oligosaccharide flippase family protein [Vibrio fluvialis]|nr:oligosaccharide flippase family protein [Vibrio fluvialis]
MSNLKKNIFNLLILQGGNYILPLLTFPYLARVLGVETFGKFGLTFTIVQYAVMFIDFGFNLSASKKIAVSKSTVEIKKIFYCTIFCKVVLIVLLLVFYFFTYVSTNSENVALLLYTIPQILGAVIFPIWYFQGIEKLSKVTISTLLGRFLIYPLMFIFVNNEDDLWKAIFIQSSAFLLVSLIGLLLGLKDVGYKIYIPTGKEIKESLYDSFPLYTANLAMSLYTISTPIIITYMSNLYEVGLFNGADRIKAALLGLFLVLGNALYPRANKKYQISEKEGLKFAKKILLYQGSLTLILSICIFFMSDIIVSFLLGGDFNEAAGVLKLLSPLLFIITTSVVFGNYVLLPLGYKKIYSTLPIFTGVIHLVICSMLVSKIGAIGGALSILLIEIITLIFYISVLYKKNLFGRFLYS